MLQDSRSEIGNKRACYKNTINNTSVSAVCMLYTMGTFSIKLQANQSILLMNPPILFHQPGYLLFILPTHLNNISKNAKTPHILR